MLGEFLLPNYLLGWPTGGRQVAINCPEKITFSNEHVLLTLKLLDLDVPSLSQDRHLTNESSKAAIFNPQASGAVNGRMSTGGLVAWMFYWWVLDRCRKTELVYCDFKNVVQQNLKIYVYMYIYRYMCASLRIYLYLYSYLYHNYIYMCVQVESI